MLQQNRNISNIWIQKRESANGHCTSGRPARCKMFPKKETLSFGVNYEMEEEKIRKSVRTKYAEVAKREVSCCGTANSCCATADSSSEISRKIGYTDKELAAVPDGANLGLGCGNPVALASLREGETVLDLGSGAGFDCFLAANRVGKNGRVIGIDMTPEMIEKARYNANKGNYRNVEFRLGEIENIPTADNSVDAVISNCVINLSTDKKRVFKETFRVLKPGGRIMISDVVLSKKLPDTIRNSVEAYVGCLSGAMMKDKYLQALKEAGFRQITVVDEMPFPIDCMSNDPTAQAIIKDTNIRAEDMRKIAGSVLSVKVSGIKPRKHAS